jgi:hypothetical protein
MPERSDLETCCLIPEHRRTYLWVAAGARKFSLGILKQMAKNKNCVLHPGSFEEYEPGIFRAIAIPKNK